MMKKNIIDLHMHSTASDGTCTPAELIAQGVAHAKQCGCPVTMALTDHDTISGVAEFLEEAAKYPEEIKAISGVEISSDYAKVEIHILGYGIDITNEHLQESLKRYRDLRDNRNVEIIKKIREQGMEISLEDIQPEKEGDSIGRPIIAKHLVKMGYVSSVKEAFDLYLADGRPCCVGRQKPSPSEVIALIQEAGGTAVLAHPVLYKKLTSEQIDTMILELQEMGLKGVEVYYSRSRPEQTAHYETFAAEHGLLVTCGTDYHGTVKPDLSLFIGEGELMAPAAVADEFLPIL